MRPILANLIITSNSFSNSTPPSLNTPGSSPLLRPISSPMTPITPLMLSDVNSEARYEKEDFFSREAGYFLHNPHEGLYTNSPYYYTATQPQVTVNISPPPLSSNVTTPTNTNSFNTFINSPQAVNHSSSLHYMNSDDHHQVMISSYAAPSHGIDYSHYNYNYYNQQLYGSSNNVGSQYDTLEKNHYYNHDAKIQNQDDAQFHEMISGLNKMDIVDSL